MACQRLDTSDTISSVVSTMPSLKLTSNILYGIFISERSFLIGVRCLVKREHVRFLVLRIAGRKLPAELADEIVDHLYALEKADIVAEWDIGNSPEENYQKFHYGEAQTDAERVAFEKMHDLNVDAAWIANSRPSQSFAGPSTMQQDCHYIHLSALKTRPSLAVALPPRCPTRYPSGILYTTTKGSLSANVTASPSEASLPADEMVYTLPKRPKLNERIVAKTKGKGKTRSEPRSVCRLLSVEGLEAATRDWDAAALEKYVELLELCVIRTERGAGGERMKPGIFVLQTWDEG
ncbi:unnamed protein product [Zymoseptoria tritici ST99CH_3D1]|nr:unnamed protein product [Zymoseptoria tritici ST99CH_3D1]